MNLATIIGFLGAMAVFSLSIAMSLENPRSIVDYPATLLVLGGTLAATLVCFPADKIWALLRVFFKRIFGLSKPDYRTLLEDIADLSRAFAKGSKAFETAITKVGDLFLKDAATVVMWIKADVTAEELRALLETRAATHYKEYMAQAKFFRTIAQFPPAFGLMGTTIGMISLLEAIAKSSDKSIIGSSMAIALVATLYGIAAANFVLVPIAENLAQQTLEDQKLRHMIIESIMLIQANKPTKYVEEHAKSFLLPSQRPTARAA